jgi:hypothetical protein
MSRVQLRKTLERRLVGDLSAVPSMTRSRSLSETEMTQRGFSAILRLIRVEAPLVK